MFTPKATEVLLKNVRLSYVHLMEPYTGVNQSKPKYSTTILLLKSDVAQKQAIDAAIAKKAARSTARRAYRLNRSNLCGTATATPRTVKSSALKQRGTGSLRPGRMQNIRLKSSICQAIRLRTTHKSTQACTLMSS